MIKGTRMIVITKNKILASCGLVLLLAVCMATVRFISSKENITAFSDYESIIDSQIAPAHKEKNKKSAEENDKTEIWEKILDHFFVLNGYVQKSEPEPEATPAPASPPPMIKSEARRADKGLKVSNATSFDADPESVLEEPLSFSLDENGPQILIMHTHTTESYSAEEYEIGAPDRNLDETKNVSAVGEAMADIFRKNGIETRHNMTVHDYPSYNGAYQRAATTIKGDLAGYGGIKVVLDVHRDGITKNDGTKVKLVTDINGEKTAQVMLVVGTNANLAHDNWRENFKFASKIQAKAIEMYPSLMRPIDVRQERFNEQLTNGSLIVEIGTNGNTLEEAQRAGRYIAEVISAVLRQ